MVVSVGTPCFHGNLVPPVFHALGGSALSVSAAGDTVAPSVGPCQQAVVPRCGVCLDPGTYRSDPGQLAAASTCGQAWWAVAPPAGTDLVPSMVGWHLDRAHSRRLAEFCAVTSLQHELCQSVCQCRYCVTIL